MQSLATDNPLPTEFPNFYAGTQTQKQGQPLLSLDPNQPTVIGWAGATNYWQPGSFTSTTSRPCFGTILGQFTVWEGPQASLFRGNFPLLPGKTLLVSDGIGVGLSTPIGMTIPIIIKDFPPDITVMTFNDYLTNDVPLTFNGVPFSGGSPALNFTPAQFGTATHGTMPLLFPFPYATILDIDMSLTQYGYLGMGTSQIEQPYQDYGIDGGSFIGGDILYVHFCGPILPYTAITDIAFDDVFGSDGLSIGSLVMPINGSESPTQVQEFPSFFNINHANFDLSTTDQGCAGLLFQATAKRHIAAVNAVLKSMTNFRIVIVCGDGSDPSPIYGAYADFGGPPAGDFPSRNVPTIAGNFPESWKALESTLTAAPWITIRYEKYSDPTMPARVLQEEVTKFWPPPPT